MAEPSLIDSGLSGACPQCGAKTMFDGPVKFAGRCGACGLDYAAFNVGDGPAAFLTLIIGALVVGLALTVDILFQPPFWIHVLLWVPFTALAVIYGLRIAKGMLLASEFRNKAREGRISGGSRGEGE